MTEAHHQYRLQFLENRAKFNHTQALPPTPKAGTVKSLFSAYYNGKNDADSILNSTEKLFVPNTDEIDAANTFPSTTKMSSFVLSDDANALPLTHEKSRSITPISELIQRFTSEMLNSEISSLEPQSQSSVKESLEFKPNDNTQTSWMLTVGSLPQSPTISSAFEAKEEPIETSVLHFVTLRRPSDFYKQKSRDIKSTEPSLQQSLVTDKDTVASKRAASLQMPPSSNVDSGVLVTVKHTPQVARKAHITTAIPFRPPYWVKLPETSTDETDATTSWIPLSSSSVEATGSPTESSVVQPHPPRASSFQSSVVQPHPTRASSFQSSVVQPHPTRASSFQSYGVQHPSRASSFQSYVARPILTRAASLQSYPMTEGSTSSEAPASSLLLLRSQEQRMHDLRKEQNSSSERIIRQSIQPNKAPNIKLSSSYKPSTNSVNLISNRESPNNHELNNSHFVSSVKLVRHSSTGTLMSFPRRSQTPTVPVKLLVKKFSANN
jgi:hypothetical protein